MPLLVLGSILLQTHRTSSALVTFEKLFPIIGNDDNSQRHVIQMDSDDFKMEMWLYAQVSNVT